MSKTVKIILIVLLVLFLIIGGLIYAGWRYAGGLLERGPGAIVEIFREHEEDISFEDIERLITEEEIDVEMMEEPEYVAPETAKEENPYDLAEEVTPMTEQDIAMDGNIQRVLGEVFEKNPKLVEIAVYYNLTYVTDRPITDQDIQDVRDVFLEDGFKLGEKTLEVELKRTYTGDESYTLVFQEKGTGNEAQVIFLTAEEGDNAQIVKVRF